MTLTPDERISYMQAVWETFQAKAKTQRDMTNAEYHQVSKWLDDGIPLFVVLRGIAEFSGKPRRLEAVEVPVEKALAYRVKAVGSDEEG